jgi:spermidine synthase
MVVIYALTLFTSALLLFLVEPMVAKMVLPLLGGAPAVWITCMLFFQAALVAGYAYAHIAPVRLGLRRHALLHVALLAIPLAVTLPIGLKGQLPTAENSPVLWLLELLTVCVGLPFFLISTTGPLLQRWFAASGHRSANDPYYLYAASNVGSMAALLCYPTLIEPAFGLTTQSQLWTAGYLTLLFLNCVCAYLVWRSGANQTDVPSQRRMDTRQADGVGWFMRARWVGWSFVPSSLMLGVTTFITTDIAPIPLLWVIPLALYLLTFILAFARLPRAFHRLAVALLPVVIIVLVLATTPDETISLAAFGDWQFRNPLYGLQLSSVIMLHLAAFFMAALVCHGELAQTRPSARHLTEYYLWISIGGVAGGIFNAVLAPQLFNRILEYPLIIVVACLLRPHFWPKTPAFGPEGSRAQEVLPGTTCWLVFGLAAGYFFYQGSYGPLRQSIKLIERNFFGVVSVRGNASFLQMIHGTTSHGMQCHSPGREREPLAYYTRISPIGQLFDAFSGEDAKTRVAVMGLGAGTLASYAEKQQHWTFYEIDPIVDRIARDPSYFTYLQDAERRRAQVRVVLGDARLQMEKSTEHYDLIVLDVFSSDSVPVHLLSREALRMYLSKLENHGLLAFNITNAYLDLRPIVASLAHDARVIGLVQRDYDVSQAEIQLGRYPSQWAVMARTIDDLGPLARSSRWRRLSTNGEARVWTDDYSNLLSAFIWHQESGLP